MHVLVTGASGLVGTALVKALEQDEIRVSCLKRPGKNGPNDPTWDIDAGKIDLTPVGDIDAVVNLAGENIASGRWTKRKKQRIRDSRVIGTQLLSEALARMPNPPKTLLSTSAIGYYGNTGDELMSETSEPRNVGFLGEVCRDWEAATMAAEARDIRVVKMRFGVVLSRDGGALKSMLTPFKLGLGGKMGSGNQYMSWIALQDVVSIIRFLIDDDRISGPVNVVGPSAATNAMFTETLGSLLWRPTFMTMPGFMAKLVLGEMAEELLLSGQRVVPSLLTRSGYQFQYPILQNTLRGILG